MEDQKRGEEIINSVFKTAILALFRIGVRSPENIEKFYVAFKEEMDKEFLKIGLFQPHIQEEAQEIPVGSGQSSAPVKSISEPIEVLGLKPLIVYNLEKIGIITIEQLMEAMQKQSLTELKGIKEKSAKQILERLKIWNQSA